MDMILPDSGTEKFSSTRGQGVTQSTTVTQPLVASPPTNHACWLPTLTAHSTLRGEGGVEGRDVSVDVCVV